MYRIVLIALIFNINIGIIFGQDDNPKINLDINGDTFLDEVNYHYDFSKRKIFLDININNKKIYNLSMPESIVIENENKSISIHKGWNNSQYSKLLIRILDEGSVKDYEKYFILLVRYDIKEEDFFIDKIFYDDGINKDFVFQYIGKIDSLKLNNIPEAIIQKYTFDSYFSDDIFYKIKRRPLFILHESILIKKRQEELFKKLRNKKK